LYEWGIVSMRVGFVLRSAEIKPLFFDLFRSNKFILNKTADSCLLVKEKASVPAAPPPEIDSALNDFDDLPRDQVFFIIIAQ